MRKTTGSAAGLLALLAVLLHVQLAPTGDMPPETEKQRAETTEPSKDKADDSEVIDGPWLATRDYFNTEGDCLNTVDVATYIRQLSHNPADPVAAKLAGFLGIDRTSPAVRDRQMWSVIATVPDPLHTRMTLTLDTQIEAIERSLQAAGWEFANQWMPWNDRFDGGEKDIGQRRRQRHLQALGEAMPGILIFRARPKNQDFPKRVLFVLLVPETATSGIAWRPFVSALNLASALSSPNPIGLLAPSFSGSFSSLASLVNAWQAKHSVDAPLGRTVYSGSASGFDYADAFKTTTHLAFHSGVVDTQDAYLKVFCEMLLKDYDIDPVKAALLREDETGLSNSFDSQQPESAQSKCHVRQYVFPRDISHLRNAYQESSGAASADPYDPSRNLNFSIRDPNSGEDSIPTYSEIQTPLSQDAVVDAIARELTERETRLVFVAASNPLDIIFLMRAIRQVAPDIRIVTDNSQILMVPGASRDPLSGTVVLSTYPMFAAGEKWLDTSPRGKSADRLVFADPSAQGIYNVTQLLLCGIGAQSSGDLPLRGYTQFAGGSAYPGVWALSLTRSGFLPLAHYDSTWRRTGPPNQKCGDDDCGWLQTVTGADQKLPPIPRTVDPPWSWRITVFCAGVAACLGSLLFVWCNVSPIARKPYWLAITEGFGPRLLVVTASALSLVALQWLLICPALYPPRQLFDDPTLPLVGRALGAVVVAGLLAPLAGVTYILFLQTRRRRNGLPGQGLPPSAGRSAVYPAITICLFLWVVGSWAFLCYNSPANSSAFFLRFRALDLYSGSSPAMPLVIQAITFFVISIFYFKRFTAGGPNAPKFDFGVNASDSAPAIEFQNRLRKAMENIQASVLASSRPGGSIALGRAVAGSVAVMVCLVVLGRYPAAFERFGYNLSLWIMLSFVLFWLAIGCYDLTLLWRRLRTMLDLLELLRLQAALKRVSRDWPRRPVWAFRRSVSKNLLNRQMIYALHGRAVSPKPVEALAAQSSKAAAAGGSSQYGTVVLVSRNPAASSASKPEVDVKEFLDAVYPDAAKSGNAVSLLSVIRGRSLPGAARELDRLRCYQKTSADIASRILQLDLRPFWRQTLEQEDSLNPLEGQDKPGSVYLRCCADFVALQCSRYVVHNVEHVQRLASSISLTFLLLLFFFNSYSPEGPQIVARFLAVVFVVIGYLIVRVLAAMQRNPILSTISRTKPGELNAEFWTQLVSLGALPLIGVLAHLFPSVSQFLFRWVAPHVQAIH